MAQAQLDVPARESDRRDAASRPRLVRSRHNRIIGGVAGGVAAHLGAPVWAVRLTFVGLVLAAGFGLVVYLLLWLLAPLEAADATPGRATASALPTRPGGRQLTGALLVIGGVIAMLWLLGFTFEGNLFWPIVLGAIGFAVIWARTGDERRRWDPASLGSPLASVLSGGRPLARLIGGGVLIVAGMAIVLAATTDLGGVMNVVLAVVVTVAGLALLAGPWVWNLGQELITERTSRVRSEARAEMAAHLHDSVLQTLAMIQRAREPREMAMLARTQERDLRAWLYGRAPSVPGVRLRDALDAMAGRIEREPCGQGGDGGRRRRGHGRGHARPGGGHQRGHPECRQPLGCGGGIGLRGGGGRCGRRLRARPRRGLRSRHRSARPAGDCRLDRGPHAAPRRIGGGGERRGWDGGAVAPAAERGGVTVRVFVVDDHELFRSGVRSELREGFEIVGDAGTVDEAVSGIRATQPDVVLLDVHMPAGGGREVISAVRGEQPDVRFLALSVSDAAEDVIGVIRAGARGYVTKSISAEELDAAIRRVHEGDAVFSPRLAGFVLDTFATSTSAEPVDAELDQLTAREREVLRYIARGYAYKEVAHELHISVKTVETHVSAVLRKLQLSSRYELTRWATDRRLV